MLDSRAHRKGLDSLDPKRNPLIRLGMEINERGRVTKNAYGVFHLSWQAEKERDWHKRIQEELQGIRNQIRQAHGVRLRFLIWVGMGGSAEDKAAYQGAGLLNRGPRCYVLDSTDPAKLKSILEDMERRSRLPVIEILKSTLVAGMALGMTSFEPVVNLEKLSALYDKHKVDARPNFVYLTMTGSLLDAFGHSRGFRRVELQMDAGNSTSGRHSSPLTRGSLYPLGLAGVDLKQWIAGTYLSPEQIDVAWQLAAFLQAQSLAGRDKVTLLTPKSWEGAALWTKQDFEESLGKSEQHGIKILIGEKIKLANYRSPKDALQDRVFLAVSRKGAPGPDKGKLSILRRAGYPLAVLTLPAGAALSSYMQLVHYTVFGLAYLRQMNFVTQPSVELYKAITQKLHTAAAKAGGIEQIREWQRLKNPAASFQYRGGISLHLPFLGELNLNKADAPAAYAAVLKRLAEMRQIEYGELTFFGDTRYSARGRAIRQCLDHAADLLFRSRLKMGADVCEGPAMNHSYHEMIIGHGRCFSTVLLSEKAESIPSVNYTSAYHRAQFLATQLALAERKRPVAAILVKDLEEATLRRLDEFFRQAASHLK
ncbi:MAG: hypothetical protein FJW20_23185 [Acidimicrobiia bacterium]|nr:hypothetical protein [Acidimicrobiia bacterium]